MSLAEDLETENSLAPDAGVFGGGDTGAFPVPKETIETDAHLSHNAFAGTGLQTNALDPVHRLGEVSSANEASLMFTMIRSVPHLYMLPSPDVRILASSVLRREFGPKNSVLEAGTVVEHVYVVLEGEVDVFVGHDRVGTVPCTNIFCLPCVVFDQKTHYSYRAGDEKTTLGLIPGEVFLEVMARNVGMAQSIGRKMAERMDVFIVFKEFCRHVFSHESTTQEYLPVWQILEAYQRIGNCIHGKMRSQEIDVGAWMYAVRRLPQTLTSTFIFELSRALPPFIASRMKELARNPNSVGNATLGDIRYVPTSDRRRCSWSLGMEGKTLVLLRDGFTDILDFLSCLCIHLIEASKLRARLQGMVDPPAIDILDKVLHCGDRCPPPAKVLARLPLSSEEQKGLIKIWGPELVLSRIYEVLMHREEYMLRVDSSISKRFQTDPFHEWALNLRAAVIKKLSLPVNSPLPPELEIDILSSNTHSTKNCLSAFARRFKKEIILFGRTKKQDITSMPWQNEEDMVYFLTPLFLKENPELENTFRQCLEDIGVQVMEDTALTGLQVDIVPLWFVDMGSIDPSIVVAKSKPKTYGQFLLNMDFAFGAQADGITKALVATFGHHIRSFSVMGKAGGLVGSRGDVQVATHVLFSKSSLIMDDSLDELRPCGNQDFTVQRMREILPEPHKIHEGPVLTIPGTMLQNEQLLMFYRRIWKCVGVEMEGSYFARQLRESWKAGLLRPELKTRFAYYTSDLPLPPKNASEAASLSLPMRPTEGVPPLYAITRYVLECVLN